MKRSKKEDIIYILKMWKHKPLFIRGEKDYKYPLHELFKKPHLTNKEKEEADNILKELNIKPNGQD